MQAWTWVVIAVCAVAVIALVAVVAQQQQRRARLRQTFGPEYERTLRERGNRREAERELSGRYERRRGLDIRPLSAEQREACAREWTEVQVRFVDMPADAVRDADSLLSRVMRERGYPVGDFEQRAADVSVDHPGVVDNYRRAHGISQRSAAGEASTEDLRQAMVHYRSLFNEMLAHSEDAQAPARGAGV